MSAVQGTVDLHTDTNVQNSEEISNKDLHSIIRQLKSALEEEREVARDREARLIKKINELDSEVRSLSEKVHQLGAAEEDRAEKLTRRLNDVKAAKCVKSTYQNTYTRTRTGTHSGRPGSTDRASISASQSMRSARRSTTLPYPRGLEPGPSRARYFPRDMLLLTMTAFRRYRSRAVVVNSNMSRGKYLAREGPGSRLPYPASEQAQAPELRWSDPPLPWPVETEISVRKLHMYNTSWAKLARIMNVERRRQQEPQWDAPDDDEGLWTLVSEKKAYREEGSALPWQA